jgi:hypothetical protein
MAVSPESDFSVPMDFYKNGLNPENGLVGINARLVAKPETTAGGASETCLKTDLTPSALFHQTNLTFLPS